MINKFSIKYNFDKKKTIQQQQLDRSARIPILEEKKSDSSKNKYITTQLSKYGFTVRQIKFTQTIFNIDSIEHGISIMMIDPETKKYNHSFYVDSNNQCKICGSLDSKGLHFSHEPDEIANRSNHELNINSIALVDRYVDEDTLEFFQNPNICPICCDNVAYITLKCGHGYCKDCLQNFLQFQIKNGRVLNIKCMNENCDAKFDDGEIYSFIGDYYYSKYNKFKNYQMKINLSSNNCINCPFPNCNELLEIDDSIFDVYTGASIIIECESGHEFCIKCMKLGRHDNCDPQPKKIIIKRDITYSKYRKFCPKCSVLLEKYDENNRIYCEICDYYFCWICTRECEDDHFAFYNFKGCPGLERSNKKSNDCVRKKCCKCLWFTFSFLVFLLLGFCIVCFFLIFGCSYEFIKCYLKKNQDNSTIDSENEDESIDSNQNENDENQDTEEEITCRKYIFCSLLAIVGVIFQPFYIVFYILYGVMECYRRFNCWFYYVD